MNEEGEERDGCPDDMDPVEELRRAWGKTLLMYFA